MMGDQESAKPPEPAKPKGELIKRQPGAIRATHWINALCVLVLFMSGLSIFNAHPRLYWGQAGNEHDRAAFEISYRETAGGGDYEGYIRAGSLSIVTTGVFGLSTDSRGLAARAFPTWMTLPASYSLAKGRNWHFFFAWILVINGLIYWLYNLISKRVKRELLPEKRELTPRHLWQDVIDHARLRFHRGEAARRYNTLQKLAYLLTGAVLLPLMILTGLTMSPGFNAIFPWLLDVFGGRQSARTIHFICAWSIFGFVVVHLVMVVASGPINNLRSMITGWYRLPPEDGR